MEDADAIDVVWTEEAPGDDDDCSVQGEVTEASFTTSESNGVMGRSKTLHWSKWSQSDSDEDSSEGMVTFSDRRPMVHINSFPH